MTKATNEIKTVGSAQQWASRKLLRLVSSGELPTTESVDGMAAEYVGDVCGRYGLDHSKWKDHLWEMVRTKGRRRLRQIGPLRAAIREVGG